MSIIILCYKQGCFLRGAIDSAASQDLEDMEIIVINDGSSGFIIQLANIKSTEATFAGRQFFLSGSQHGNDASRVFRCQITKSN